MPKFKLHKSGKAKNGKQYLSYDVNIPASKLKNAGFIKEDGTLLECIAKVENRKIILEHKEDIFKD